MECFLKVLDLIALLIQLVGAIVMYYNSPQNRATGTQSGGDYNNEKAAMKNRMLSWGFLLLAVGIALSIILLIVRDFFLTVR
jgi:hypothetical protein